MLWQGNCKIKCVVYEATVVETVSGKFETYTGLTYRTFKGRFNEHNNDMRKPDNRLRSRLVSRMWELKDNGTDHTVNWKLLERAPAFNPVTKAAAAP